MNSSEIPTRDLGPERLGSSSISSHSEIGIPVVVVGGGDAAVNNNNRSR